MAAIQEYVRKVYYIIEKWETAFVVSFFVYSIMCDKMEYVKVKSKVRRIDCGCTVK